MTTSNDVILKSTALGEYKVICVCGTYFTDSLLDALATYQKLTGKEFTGKIKNATAKQVENW